ncbi:MAG TPA: helix-turn-helix domain-containing protein [Candidatus Yonathbacteria bacterium]|nr:helix-turn-helix domain-containing protein [Candidatus Yonathbacteria bacterium]
MPHISNKKINKKIEKEVEKYLESIIKNAGSKARGAIFNEILTKTEKIMLAKRVGILYLLKKGFSIYKVSVLLGVSPSTVVRFKLKINSKKYRHTIDWVWKHSKEGKLDAVMEPLISLIFTGKTKTFKKFVDDL